MERKSRWLIKEFKIKGYFPKSDHIRTESHLHLTYIRYDSNPVFRKIGMVHLTRRLTPRLGGMGDRLVRKIQ
jgi:hypothetical protein